jgi:hypothetical protein
MKFAYIFFCIILFSSCTLIRILNTSKEQNEDKKQIDTYLKKHKIKYDFSFENYDSSAYLLNNPNYRINGDTLKYSYIQLRVYNAYGDLFSGYSQCMGDFNNKKFIDSFPIKKNLNPYINSNLRFENELDLIQLKQETKIEILKKSKQFEYTFVVYWTIWTKYFSKHVLKEVSKLKKAHPNKICVILVNTAKNIE